MHAKFRRRRLRLTTRPNLKRRIGRCMQRNRVRTRSKHHDALASTSKKSIIVIHRRYIHPVSPSPSSSSRPTDNSIKSKRKIYTLIKFIKPYTMYGPYKSVNIHLRTSAPNREQRERKITHLKRHARPITSLLHNRHFNALQDPRFA